ncbi:GNAT family N-acetyltransferase [Chloroflexota bacterium]
MSDSHYVIRNYQPSDFNKYALLNIEAERLETTGRCVSPQVITEQLDRPNYSPEQDLFLAELAGNIVGYMDATPELTIGRVILDCWIQPEHRRRGLAKELLGFAMQHAKKLRVKVAHVNIPEDNAVAKGVLSGMGFQCVRRFLELKLDMAELPRQAIDQDNPGYCHIKRGEADKLTYIQNRSFVDTWGFNPNTIEEITYRTSLSNSSPEDIVLTAENDKVTGYCWTGATDAGIATGERKGRIFMIGVDPDYRGMGLGKRVLLAGLAHLNNKGMRVAELTVDSENKAACDLYRSVGFKVRTSSLWYEKVIDQATGVK